MAGSIRKVAVILLHLPSLFGQRCDTLSGILVHECGIGSCTNTSEDVSDAVVSSVTSYK
jgi:hypothetical protein